MSAPLVVNTTDGTCWVRRTVTRGGLALYAPMGVCSCPEFVMATMAELAEHGIAGSADVLPMPVASQPDTLAEQLGDVRPASTGLIASMVKSVRDCREHEHPTWEDLFCLNLTSYMGERMAPVLRRLVDSEAEAERLRARVTELERRYLPKVCECGHSRLVHTVPEPHSCFAGKVRGAQDCGCAEYRQMPLAEAERRRDERQAAESVDTLTALFAPTQALCEDPHDSPLHHAYQLGRDLPETGGAS